MTKKQFVPVLALSAALLAGCDPAAMPPSCRLPESVPANAAAPEVLLGMDTLPGLLFDGNLPIHLAANRVHTAKTELNLARAALLPSLNFGALLFAAGQPQFAWSSVEAVVPFLIPGNWFRASQARSLLEAEKLSLQILEQNQLASAVSTVSLWLVDLELLDVQREEAEEAELDRARIEQAYLLGIATLEDQTAAVTRQQTAAVTVAQVEQLVAQEEASLRRALGLRAGTVLRGDRSLFRFDSSPSETMAVESLVTRALEVSPESRQLSYLLEAASRGKWESIFAFAGGVGLSQSVEEGKISRSFEDLTGFGGLSFGAAYFPALKLSHRNIREIALRVRELELEFQELFQGLQARLAASRLQLDAAIETTRQSRKVLASAKLRGELGLAEMWEIREAEATVKQARLAELRSRAELGLSRLAWQRVLQEGPFAELPACLPPDEIPGARKK